MCYLVHRCEIGFSPHLMEILQLVEAHICTKSMLFGMFNHEQASDRIVDADASTGLSFSLLEF